MLKEIFEQPRAISDTLIGRIKEERGEVDFEELKLPDLSHIKKIWMVACGTSYHACMIGKQMFEANLRIPVETDIASEFRYRDPIIAKDHLLILVSQSGETADTIAAIRKSDSEMGRCAGQADTSCQYNSGGSCALPLDSRPLAGRPSASAKR